MDQHKIGEFLKELRKEKGLTQEELADRLYVTRRTVSRWETGSNLPDLEVLVELADLYDVDMRDIFNGQRRENNMDNEIKDTLLQAADYTQEIREDVKKRMNIMFILAIVAMVLYLATIFGPDTDSHLWEFMKGVTLGMAFGMLVVGCIMTSPLADSIVKWKNDRLREKEGK